jgi:hypothetical protein
MRRALLALAIWGGCGGQEAPAPPSPAPPPFHFTEESVPTVVWCGRKEKPHLLESGGSGLALLDYDGDGDLDLYVVNGWRLDGEKVAERGRNALWRNRGDGTFEDVTEQAGVGDDGWGCGAAVGDVEGDGDPDLFVTNFGKDVLYVNRGDGTFARARDPPGIDGWSTGAVFLDADGDGDEDLYVAGYIDCTLDEVLLAKPTLEWHGTKVMFGPFGLEGKRNAYFENAGGGRFVEATAKAGLLDAGAYFSFGVMALDVDGDLDLDLYVANDSNPNYLYRNDGGGRFREVGLWSGAALDAGGAAQAGMGVGAGDVDGDGDPDILVTNFEKDATTLYRNDGRCLFADVSEGSGVKGPTYAPLSWGTAIEDLDLDGDLDLFVANGHIYPQADSVPEAGTSYAQTNLLLMNRGDGRFVDASRGAGPGLLVSRSSRGVAAGDLDNDGDVDLVVSNVDAPPTILRNGTARRGRWLTVDAPGARKVVVEAGGKRWTRHEVRGGSFCSASDPRFHFGLGEVARIDRMTVTWPDGREQAVEGAAPDRLVRVARSP